jgi:peptide/nickel transport system permease protein
MPSYFVKRLLLVIPTLFGISLISFVIIHLAPGGPIREDDLHGGGVEFERARKETNELYGLDQPLYIQYGRWVKRLATLDFGRSLRDRRPVTDTLKERVPVSVKLGAISLLVAYLISIPIGIYSATHQYSHMDRVITTFLFGLYSLPNFWVATMAIVYFGGGDFWNVFPVVGLYTAGFDNWSFWERLLDQVWHLILPVTCMTYYTLAVLSRYMRTGMLENVRQDYIRTARAKGLAERVVVWRHAARNSLIPIVTLLADVLPALIGGSIVVETLFSIPGMGRLSYEAVINRDYPMVMGIFTLSALLTLVGILAADFLYTVVDPRIRYDGQEAAG